MKYLRLFLLIVFLISIPSTLCLAVEDKTKIGFIRLNVSQKLDSGFGEFCYELLTEQIVKIGKFIVVEGEEIYRVSG